MQLTIYRRLQIGRDGHLDQSEAYDISLLVTLQSSSVATQALYFAKLAFLDDARFYTILDYNYLSLTNLSRSSDFSSHDLGLSHRLSSRQMG